MRICKRLAKHPLGKPGHNVALVVICSNGRYKLRCPNRVSLQNIRKDQLVQHIDGRNANEVPTNLE